MPVHTLDIVPLGGLGRIGGNMMVYETEQDLLVVDCGLHFPSDYHPGIHCIMPNLSYIKERRHKLRGVVLTHAHEDHIGAIPFFVAELDTPFYASPFTRHAVEARTSEVAPSRLRLHTLADGGTVQLGAVSVESIPVTHSIPGAIALAVHTQAGTVLHTGDFKLDGDPVDGRHTELQRLRELGDRGILALLSDSTNAEHEGHTWSERSVGGALDEIIADAPGRVFVSTFSSHIHRIQLVIDASVKAKRRIIPAGRSVEQMVGMALGHDYLRAPHGTVLAPDEFAGVAPHRLTVLASGCQGESTGTLARIAEGKHGLVFAEPGDTVVLSARRIPGNERQVGRLINSLLRRGVTVIDDRHARVHTSGHAFRDEQREMIELCRPRYFVPVHGEYRHMLAHARLAADNGVDPEGVFLLEDGQPLRVTTDTKGRTHAERLTPIEAADVYVDSRAGLLIDGEVLRARRHLRDQGVVSCVVAVDSVFALRGPARLVAHGVTSATRFEELRDGAHAMLRQAFDRTQPESVEQCMELVRVTLRRFFKDRLERKPVILPQVVPTP